MTGIVVLIVIGLIAFIFIAYKPAKGQEQKQPQPQIKTEPIEDPERETPQSESKLFRIAGINNYCNYSDIGPISGELRNEPDNRYDKNAVMVLEANKNKLLGYIAKQDQPEYRKIANGEDRRPFVGYIEKFENEEGETRYFGVIRTYANEDEAEMMKDIQNDWDFLHAAFKIRSYNKRLDILNQFKY